MVHSTTVTREKGTQRATIMQSVYSKLSDNMFYTRMAALIAYLRRQQSFTAAIRSEVARVADTRSELMAFASFWYKKFKISISEHLDKK